MEQEKKKIDIKTIIIIIITIIAIAEGIFIFASKGIFGGLKEKDIIGNWTNDNDYTLELYEGGTGKNAGTPLTWEIKGKFLNVTENYYNFGTKKIVYKLENDTLTSVDGERIYHKSK